MHLNFLRKALGILSVFTLVFSFAFTAFAHSTVSPSQVGTSKYENFSLSVPTEKELPTTGIHLVIPPEISKVTPFVKAGWRINISKDATGKVTAVEWSGGSVPAGQKDIFQFTAVTPKEEATLVWKVHQTYQDGTVVAWDQDPKGSHEHEEGKEVKNPYSVTEVLGDAALLSAKAGGEKKKRGVHVTLVLSLLALALAGVSLALSLKKRT